MHEKEFEKLQAEKEKIEQQLAQEQHKGYCQELCAKMFADSG